MRLDLAPGEHRLGCAHAQAPELVLRLDAGESVVVEQVLGTSARLAASYRVTPPEAAGAARRYLYAPGDPGVLQVETGRPGTEAWSYYGFRPLAVDAEGWVIRARIWPAACPRPGCRVRTAAEALTAVRRAEAAAFADEGAGRTAVWARQAR